MYRNVLMVGVMFFAIAGCRVEFTDPQGKSHFAEIKHNPPSYTSNSRQFNDITKNYPESFVDMKAQIDAKVKDVYSGSVKKDQYTMLFEDAVDGWARVQIVWHKVGLRDMNVSYAYFIQKRYDKYMFLTWGCHRDLGGGVPDSVPYSIYRDCR